MPSTMTLTSTEAQLYVRDGKSSAAFYCDKLGFTLAFTYGEPPHYAMVTRDAAKLCLRRVDEPVFVGDVRERQQLLSASLTLGKRADIDQLFAAYQAKAVPMFQTLRTEPWGACTFIVRDPDGNLILFAGPAV